MSNLHFQYCPKLAIFDQRKTSVFLCRRKGEADYDGVFSFIGGKMEHNDGSIVEALRREKNEEVGGAFKVSLLPYYSVDTFFEKKDGNRMILPHFFAEYASGSPALSDEYSESIWMPLSDLESCQSIIRNIVWIAPLLLFAGTFARRADFVLI